MAPPAIVRPANRLLWLESQMMVERLNVERRGRRLAPVAYSDALPLPALWIAHDCAARGRLDHSDLDGGGLADRLASLGLVFSWSSEVLAAGGPGGAAAAVGQWLASRVGHRAVLLDPRARRVAFAWVETRGGQWAHFDGVTRWAAAVLAG